MPSWTSYKGMDVPDTNPGEAGNKLTNDIKALADRTYGTSGGVSYMGSSGPATQDSSNFFWDATNKRLGIGTNSPDAQLTFGGSAPVANFRDGNNRYLTISGPTGSNASIAVSNTGAGLDITTTSGTINVKIGGTTLAQFSTGTSLLVGGSFGLPITLVNTATHNISATECVIKADASSGAITLTLPTAVGCAGRQYYIKKVDNLNNVTINTTSSQTIDGNTSKVLSTQWDHVIVISDNSNWLVF